MSTLLAVLLVCLGLTEPAYAQSGPGDPFGGNTTGCVPLTSESSACSAAVSSAFARFEAALTNCHLRLVNAQFRKVTLGQRGVFDEPACVARAVTRFDTRIARLARGVCVGSPILGTATDDRVALQAAVERENDRPYCDATSAVLLRLEANGFVPATVGVRRCADATLRRLRGMSQALRTCQRRAAARGYRHTNPPFDLARCVTVARTRFASASTRLERGACPPCLDAEARIQLADDVQARVDAGNAASFPCADPILRPGELRLDRPTLIALGVQWLVRGDDNHNAVVTVRYRPLAGGEWREGLPLYRVRPEVVKDRVIAPQFAGSIFDLRPATTYEIELHASDPDGGVDETRVIVATTRAVPSDPATPRNVPVATAAEFQAALDNAQPGDVIHLADGVYAGPFVLEAGGTAENPIVIRGTTRDGTILDGQGCNCNVFEAYGSFTHVEQLTLRNANRALRFQTAGAEANVVRRVRSYDTRLGFAAREDQVDFYLCDNELQGPLVWPHVYFDDGGLYSNVDGILIQGSGHVVCHNQLAGFGDALKTEQAGARAIDFYGNEVLSAYDNGVELDYGEGNVRCWRNRFTNNFVPISFQPIHGGPAYAFRNVAVNTAHEQLKFHGIGSGTGPSGVLVYHNTFVSPASALLLSTSAASHYFDIANNLFVGPAVPSGRVVDWSGPINNGTFDFNGYFPDGAFRFVVKSAGTFNFDNFAALQNGGYEGNGRLLSLPIFASGLVAPPAYTVTLPPQDVQLDPSSGAIDAGRRLPNLNDDFTGNAPDLGAFESGCAAPLFGIRPDGIDESNQPLGCTP